MEVFKFTTRDGQTFFTNQPFEVMRLFAKPDVTRAEKTTMTDEEYAALLTSTEAGRFFA